MFIIKSIVNFIADICFFILIVYGLLCAPMVFSYNPLVVTEGGGLFEEGTLIYSMKVEEEDIKNNDIIIFNNTQKYVPARVEGYEKGIFEVQPSKNKNAETSKVTINDIKGKDMNIHIPYIGYFIQFIQEHSILLVFCIGVIILEAFLSFVDRSIRKATSKR